MKLATSTPPGPCRKVGSFPRVPVNDRAAIRPATGANSLPCPCDRKSCRVGREECSVETKREPRPSAHTKPAKGLAIRPHGRGGVRRCGLRLLLNDDPPVEAGRLPSGRDHR